MGEVNVSFIRKKAFEEAAKVLEDQAEKCAMLRIADKESRLLGQVGHAELREREMFFLKYAARIKAMT